MVMRNDDERYEQKKMKKKVYRGAPAPQVGVQAAAPQARGRRHADQGSRCVVPCPMHDACMHEAAAVAEAHRRLPLPLLPVPVARPGSRQPLPLRSRSVVRRPALGCFVLCSTRPRIGRFSVRRPVPSVRPVVLMGTAAMTDGHNNFIIPQ